MFLLTGIVNDFLSWKIFIPLSRLTYAAYLVHLNYIYMYYGHARTPIYYTSLDELHAYFGMLVMILGLAAILCLTVEIPLLNVLKLFLGRPKSISS